MSDEAIDAATAKLLMKSIKWRTAAGWLIVFILAWHYLIHSAVSVYIVAHGGEALDPLPELSLADVMAIVGLPLGGAVADRLKE